MLNWKDVSNFDFKVVTLFEEIQLKWLLIWHNHEKLGVLLNKYPDVSWHMKFKAPTLKDEINEIEKKYKDIPYTKELEREFCNNLEDWIIYATDPDVYDKQTFNKWDDEELLSIIDFKGKTVVDIGSGTGSQLFRMVPYAKTLYAVEPVGNLRRYLKEKIKSKGYMNTFVVDGIMTELPFPNEFCDVTVSGHVFGDFLEDEFKEMNRIVKSGGMLILIPGNNDEDNDTHKFLIERGFEFATFLEPGDGLKRKYWLIKK